MSRATSYTLNDRTEQEVFAAYEKSMWDEARKNEKRFKRYLKYCRRLLSRRRFDALKREIEDGGQYAIGFTKTPVGKDQESDFMASVSIKVYQRTVHEDFHAGTIAFPVKGGWWFQWGFSC